MDFITTRADKVLEHNKECGACEYSRWCLGGCRASGLSDSGQKDLLYRDTASCAIFKGGYGSKLVQLMKDIRPEASSPVLRDKELMDMFANKQMEV